MSLPAVTKHLKVLEKAGLITKTRDAQWRPCKLNGRAAQGRGRLDGAVSRVLGRELRPPGSVFENRHRQEESERKETWPQKISRTRSSITRVYDAPVEAVWDAWTDPEQVAQWWGPRGFTLTTHSKDLRPGGTGTTRCTAPTASTTRTRRSISRSRSTRSWSTTTAATTTGRRCSA